jgi:exodeoxyribonuclease VIII
MTREEYDAIDAVNYSTLKELRRSPLHYAHRLKTPREDSTRLALGRAVHTAVFEPDRFFLDYALFPGARRAGKDWDECCKANRGRTILKSEEYRTALAIRDAVRSHPVAGPALTPPGEAEKSIVWTDEATGLRAKGRIDWWRVGLFCDLKTTSDVDRDRFGALAYRMGYHGQLSFYRAGLIANGLDAPVPRIIAVEAAPPHDVAVFPLDDDLLYQGEILCAELLAAAAAFKFSGLAPGRYPEEVALTLPPWVRADDGGDATGLDLLVPATAEV